MAHSNICGIQRGCTPDHLFFTGLGLGQSEADPCQQPAHHRDQVWFCNCCLTTVKCEDVISLRETIFPFAVTASRRSRLLG
jgi:hypothetical protein